MFLSTLLEIHPLINPELGLSVWTILTFLMLLIILRVFAWKPITTAIRKREHFINDSLEKAALAKEEFFKLQTRKDEIIKEAESKKLAILKEAEDIKQKTIQTAEIEAKKQVEEIKRQNLEQLNVQKKQIMSSIEQEVAKLAIDIAEKVLEQELTNKTTQENIINKFVKNIRL